MRILHICTEKSWRGGENQIRLLIEGSRSSTIEHHVAVPAGGRSFERFKQIGPTIPLNGKTPWHPLSIWRLVRYCHDKNIDLIDAQGSGGLSLALWVQKFVPRVQIVAHRRVDIEVAKNFFSKKKYLNPAIFRFVAISQKIKSTMVACGIDETRIVVVPSAIDKSIYEKIDRENARIQLLQEHRLPKETVLLGNASALVTSKGNQFTIEALPAVLKKVSRPVHLFLAGEGPQREELESLVRVAGLSDRVTFLGHIQNVPQFLSAIDILVMPSLSEGLGTIILDAICAGATVVATQVGGIPEIIHNQETGYLFPAGDVESLSVQLIRLIEDEVERKRLLLQAQQHVDQNFSLKRMIEGNLSVYRKCLESLNG